SAEAGVGGRDVTGVQTVLFRSLTRAVSRPALILCPDDQSAQKCQIELAAFLGAAPALLPSREFTFCEAAVVSRGWEQRRLHLLRSEGRRGGRGGGSRGEGARGG